MTWSCSFWRCIWTEFFCCYSWSWRFSVRRQFHLRWHWRSRFSCSSSNLRILHNSLDWFSNKLAKCLFSPLSVSALPYIATLTPSFISVSSLCLSLNSCLSNSTSRLSCKLVAAQSLSCKEYKTDWASVSFNFKDSSDCLSWIMNSYWTECLRISSLCSCFYFSRSWSLWWSSLSFSSSLFSKSWITPLALLIISLYFSFSLWISSIAFWFSSFYSSN